VDLWICECHRQLAREHQLRRALERALAERPEWYQGRQELSRLLVRRGLSLHPAEEFESEPEASVDELELQLTEQTLLPASRQSWNLIDGQLTSLAEQFPKQSRIALLQAERWLDQSVVEQARKLLSDHQEKDPQNAELALALVRLLRWQENREQIDNTGAIYEVVEALRRAKGERAALRLLNAEVRGLGATQTSFDPDEIEQFWGDTETWPIAARRELACGLLKLAQRSGSDSSLIGIGRIAVGVGLRDLELLAQVAAAAERTGNRDLAKQAREAIVRVEGEAGPWGRLLSAYATLLKFLPLDGTPGAALSSAVLSELITASDDLEQASAQCPDWGLAHRLRGIAWDLLGQSEEAGKAFELAVLHGDRSAEPRNWLTDLLFRLQRDRELVELHESWSGKIRWTLLSGDLSLPGVFDLPLGVKPGREQADQLALAQLAVARKAPLEETLPTVIQLTRKAPHLPEAWQLWVRLAVEQGGAAAGRAVVQQVATAVPPQPPHLRPLIEALCWDALGEQSLVENRFRESFEVESNNWQSTREWIFWLVRRGDFDQALSHLDAPPPRLAAGLVSGFHNWSRLMRHTLGAAGATALPEFRRHLAEMKPEGTGARNSFWQDRWWACVSRGRAPQEDRQGVEWLDLRRQSVGLTADQKVARLRSRVRLGDAQAWSDWRSETAGQPADLETTLLILQPLLRNPQRRQSPELESQIDEAFEFLRKTEPKSLRTRAVDAAHALQEGFSQNGATAYLGYQQRLSAKSPAELLQDLAGAGRLERLRSRLASLAPTPRDDALPWSALDRFPNHREVFLKGGAIPELEPLWKVPSALECLQDEALLLVGLGLESIADVDAAREIFAGYSRRGRQPTDRFELALFLARRGELDEAQQVINLMPVNSSTSEADLSLGIAGVFASAPSGHDLWSVPLRRLEAVRTVGLKPEQAWQVRRELARLKALNFHEEQALEDCLQLVREQPDDLITKNNLAWLRGITGQNTAEARAEIDALIERHGELPELLDTRALIGLIQGDWTQVRADLESAFAQAPIGRYLAQLAVCQAQLGERSTAQRTAQHAVQLGFQANAWLPPERGLWEEEFKALLRESVDASPVSASPPGTDGRNPPSKTEKTP
jgi:hypothetical protein